MTHEDIYTKFMIEYDKALITSSYPSLTPYEIAVILDKACLAYIAQKVTGNNPRQVPFEADTKAIEDVRPLITSKWGSLNRTENVENGMQTAIPSNMLYYIQAVLEYTDGSFHTVDLISHENAKKFVKTVSNIPWIKQAVAYIEGNNIVFLYDPFDIGVFPVYVNMTYIRKPSYFVQPHNKVDFESTTEFELSDSSAEEVINLAIMMAAENVESPRAQSKAQMRSLEA